MSSLSPRKHDLCPEKISNDELPPSSSSIERPGTATLRMGTSLTIDLYRKEISRGFDWGPNLISMRVGRQMNSKRRAAFRTAFMSRGSGERLFRRYQA
jgi:hypothetical protein